ncbi:hypothetical protein F5X96DRAFT_617531 [Biscogniauxia mediterranea]|nr:hypothetical protein F5X96DRAFT_617531 [Biscogniauxia mediterranea]
MQQSLCCVCVSVLLRRARATEMRCCSRPQYCRDLEPHVLRLRCIRLNRHVCSGMTAYEAIDGGMNEVSRGTQSRTTDY